MKYCVMEGNVKNNIWYLVILNNIYHHFNCCRVWRNAFNTIPESISERGLDMYVNMGIQKVIDLAPK